jgi:4,5-DOPA dioxygenase extradiol
MTGSPMILHRARSRRALLHGGALTATWLAAGGIWGGCRPPAAKEDDVRKPTATPGRMPVLFVGHGSPMNAIEDNAFTRAFTALGQALPRPRAILAVSAHWYLPGTFVTSNDAPPTIHDFGGFPQSLFEIQYPARGEQRLVAAVERLLKDVPARGNGDWGLDHGTWSVLRWVFPDASVPVVQLSIDERLPPRAHLALGQKLRSLRDEGVLVVGSGNITHNLKDAFARLRSGDTSNPAWAERFDNDAAEALRQHDHAWLTDAMHTDVGRLAAPTPEHYLPLLYAAGASSDDDAVSFPVEGITSGLSMRAVRWG